MGEGIIVFYGILAIAITVYSIFLVFWPYTIYKQMKKIIALMEERI